MTSLFLFPKSKAPIRKVLTYYTQFDNITKCGIFNTRIKTVKNN